MEIILCVPGKWKDRSEIVITLAALNNDDWLLAGNVLMHVPANDFFEVEICEHDDRMKDAFDVAGAGRLSAEELDEIDSHTFVVYIIGKGGDLENAAKIMTAGQAFLNAGGLGIKVENCGKAFAKESWKTLIEMELQVKYYRAFVILLISEEDYIYTCGMHNLGLRDTMCDYNSDIKNIAEVIQIFSLYQLIENPVIKDGQTFSPEDGSQVYKIYEQNCSFYEEGELFYNPFGVYYLREIS